MRLYCTVEMYDAFIHTEGYTDYFGESVLDVKRNYSLTKSYP